MISYIEGTVIFSDGSEMIVQTCSGVGYQIYSSKIIREGSNVSLYLSHIIKEASQELYGFGSLKEKKVFEMLLSVKGVGPKSAFALTGAIGMESLLNSIRFEDKKMLTSAPGIGQKAASQIILDLQGKIEKLMMYNNDEYCGKEDIDSAVHIDKHLIINDALLACKELGFEESKIMPVIRNLMNIAEITRAEQLVHLVLKEV